MNIDELSQLQPGPEIGRGNQFAMRQLGVLSVFGTNVHSGLKIPNHGFDASTIRLQLELEAIELLLSQMPEHSEKVPQYMTLLAIEGEDNAVAILTEDASQGGSLSVNSASSLIYTSQRALSIKKAFKHVTGTRVEMDDIDHSFAFLVGDDERFLDFTPPPVRKTTSLKDNDVAHRIYRLVEDKKLSVTVSPESPLGQSFARQ